MNESWPIVDVNKQLEEFGDRLIGQQVAGHEVVDEDVELDAFGSDIGPDAGRFAR